MFGINFLSGGINVLTLITYTLTKFGLTWVKRSVPHPRHISRKNITGSTLRPFYGDLVVLSHTGNGLFMAKKVTNLSTLNIKPHFSKTLVGSQFSVLLALHLDTKA